jgi:hypothetical protein
MATDKNVAELEDDFEIEVEDDTPEEDRGREPMPEDIVKSLDEDDELENFSKEKAKQLKKVWHDERRAKEAALREREEAVGLLRRFAEENKTLKKSLHNGEQAYVGTAKVAFERELDAAKKEFKDAYDSGDSDRLTEAQEKLFEAKLKLKQVENYRPQYQEDAGQFEENVVNTSSNDGWSVTPVEENTAPQPDPKAAAWQKRNPWFGENRVMTSMAFGLHEDLVGEGVDPTSDAYYARIDKEMRRRFPESFEGNDRKRPGTVVASAKRSTAPRKVTLTATQVSLARKLGLTPEQYAKEMIKLNGDTNG